jgi:CRISPR-associated protein Cmr3
MVGVVLEPVDTWFFSDGAPSVDSGAAHSEVGGVFPPSPRSVVGALRAGLASAHGWRGGPWPPEICRVLGDGYQEESLGSLRFDGPYLVRGDTPLYPAPAHLVTIANSERLALLAPEPKGAAGAVWSDLGSMRLPVLAGGKCARPLPEPAWLTGDDLLTVLRGKAIPSHALVPQSALWRDEARVGIRRDNTRRAVEAGALYLTRHVRLDPAVGLYVHVAGLPTDWEARLDGLVTQLGGEARMAACRRRTWATVGPPLEEILEYRRLVLVALTPWDVDVNGYLRDRVIPELPGVSVVSACLPRSRRIGGWAEIGQGHDKTLVTRSVLAPGSVFFVDVIDPSRFREAVTVAGGQLRVGRFTSWGFGVVGLGTWPEEA